MRPFVLACLVSLPFAVAAQQMYKWVDEKGVTHYTDSPPPDGNAAAKKIDIRAVPPSGPVTPPQSFQQKELQGRGEKTQKDQAEAEAEKAKVYKEARCSEAKRQIAFLAIQRPVFTMNDKGEKVYMEDNTRQAQIDRWTSQRDQFCS